MEPTTKKDIKQLKTWIWLLKFLKSTSKLREWAINLIYKIETSTAGESDKERLKREFELSQAQLPKDKAFIEYFLQECQAELQALKRGGCRTSNWSTGSSAPQSSRRLSATTALSV
jgi:hypothetical protein